ncbi:MAG: PLP-dependent transferase [Verrucomicrobia bacterium]|nr:MAG: PLP-dependent transferase [Verrucomicrobiota bacterium]
MSVKIETLLAQAGCGRDAKTGALATPIYQTATFEHPELGRSTGFDYSRTSNPTRLALEETLAAAEGGARGLAFASGMAALDALLRLFQPGDRVVVTEDLYGGTYRLLEKIFRPAGVEAIYVDTSQTELVKAALAQPNVRAVLLETPSNPLLKIADIPAIAKLAKARGLLTMVDNTFLTFYLQRPLELGADVVVYSASKYLGGHNDVVAGALIARTPELGERLAFFQNAVGGVLGPQDSWLLLRGLKTLPLRLRQQQQNAQRIAELLANHPRVRKVFYPGLPSHPGYAVLARESSGFGAMLAFEVESASRVAEILKRVRVFRFAESLGGVESLITYPLAQTHADIPAEIRDRLGINDRLLRLSAGIENTADLIGDLEAVL